MMAAKDRRTELRASSVLNGIDFVGVASADQRTLHVHFVNDVAVAGTLTAPPTITGGESIPSVSLEPIAAADWQSVNGKQRLTLRMQTAGDFSDYTLALVSPVLDPYFATSAFSFKALCPSDLDCADPADSCPPIDTDRPPIDYLAKDFLSFRSALLGFSAQRYPEWQERSEADFGVMIAEALSALGDDLSYTQDRVAQESELATATERRSIVRLARLVDYEPRPVTASRVLLRLDVLEGSVPPGLPFSAAQPDGSIVVFETGAGLNDSTPYTVSPKWNRLVPYYWDDSNRCLSAGSRELWVGGHGLELLDPNGELRCRQILVDTRAENTADAPTRELVAIASVSEEQDQLFLTSGQASNITRIGLAAGLRFDHDLTADASGVPRTLVYGNLVPATQGRRAAETFAVERPPPSAPGMPVTLCRVGPNACDESEAPVQLFTLRDAPLAYLAPERPDPTLDDSATWPLPEILLTARAAGAFDGGDWTWRRTLLDAEPFETAFTVDPARYVKLTRNSDGTTSFDYAGRDGATIRFGEGVFGESPDPGMSFDVTYRVGAGAAGNVAADTITRVEATAAALVTAVTNPFPASGGEEAETDEQVRRRAPSAFRARQFRVVRPEDYVWAAETLPWVQRAGSSFRWTGSWLTAFTTADPRGSEALALAEHLQLIQLLNRRRMAGYESYAPGPRYASLDIELTVCAEEGAFRGDVHAALLDALSAAMREESDRGFFQPDRWSFGQPLERSRLEAAIQSAPGVAGVTSIVYRRRGVSPAFGTMPDVVPIARDEILRVDNDPSLPERGTLRITVEGGK
jgi:hypothetical protein